MMLLIIIAAVFSFFVGIIAGALMVISVDSPSVHVPGMDDPYQPIE